ncbi:hypothetical protein, partial [Geminicoccus harenae]|uniref:hypothetical protein n=1 Tax=Geminicoccus harenae TaxID=2498453 RepID=UPI001C940D40
ALSGPHPELPPQPFWLSNPFSNRFLVMTLDQSQPPDLRLSGTNYFSEFSYNEIAKVELKLHALPVNTYFPGDYRSIDELQRDIAANSS